MKCVILAGGMGTRLSEETVVRPKPMVEIGDRPILWHIMKIYTHHGITDFIVCLGYKGYMIKEYFANYNLHNADVTFDFRTGDTVYHKVKTAPWKVTLIDTGQDTMTGGRLKRVASYLDPNEPFCMTYGDGLADVDITAQIAFHKEQGRKATVTCVRPPARFGRIGHEDGRVTSFEEKPAGEGGLINGGFFVLDPSVIDYIDGDRTSWENEPLQNLVRDDALSAWLHKGFWQPMDTQRDKNHLQKLWSDGQAAWKVW